MDGGVEYLDRILDPVTRCFDEHSAVALVALKADEELVAEIEDLSDRQREGLLSAEEENRLQTYCQVTTLISALQAKARLHLRELAGR